MKFNDCPGCHTELSEYACSLHRVAPDLLAALKAAPLPTVVGTEFREWYYGKRQAAIAKTEEGS